MTFNSYSFIFLFLPITALLFYLFKYHKKWETAKIILLASSLLFIYMPDGSILFYF